MAIIAGYHLILEVNEERQPLQFALVDVLRRSGTSSRKVN